MTQTLSSIAQIEQSIREIALLSSIAAAIAHTTEVESVAVLSAMQSLLIVAQELQNSVSKFQVDRGEGQ